ncbi:M14 family metallocarboxypeptidase [Paenibacillus algorifonticola]|uniref:M14 family metallopeptidase n=1 Tax=Paenibacillus algorifonticola TaxID=684063 RepID=UPI003D2D7089
MHLFLRKRTLLGLLIMAIVLPTLVAASGGGSKQAIINPKQLYSYEIMTRDMKKLAEAYPELIRYRSLGKSEYGRELWLMEIGNGPVNVLLNASHHAREWMTTITVMNMAETMAASAAKQGVWKQLNTADLFDHITFQIVPMVNPDGVTLQQKGLAAFPQQDHAELIKMNKNSRDFKRWKANGKGVDLNRQYPADWDTIRQAEYGPSYKNYKGKKPLEAKEAQLMYNFTKQIKPEIAISYHSSGEIIFWNFKTKASNLPRDRAFVQAYAAMTGYRAVAPEANPSGGGFTDWFITEFGKPALTPEIAPAVGETNVPLSYWDRIWKQHKDTMWLIGTTAYEQAMLTEKAKKASATIELTSPVTTYRYPVLNRETASSVKPGVYKVTREKGSWYEIQTSVQGSRWIAKSVAKPWSKPAPTPTSTPTSSPSPIPTPTASPIVTPSQPSPTAPNASEPSAGQAPTAPSATEIPIEERVAEDSGSSVIPTPIPTPSST